MADESAPALTEPWAHPWEEVAAALEISPDEGLDEVEARKRRKRFGLNLLKTGQKKSPWVILWDQVKNPIMALLVLAAAISFSFGRFLEGISIGVAIVINGAIGFFTELKAVRSMEALQRMGRGTAKVLRGGALREIDSKHLVPGDIVHLEAGDMREALQTGVLCNNADLGNPSSADKGDAVGDPLEIALLRAGVDAGWRRGDLLQSMPEEREEAFDPGVMMMATFHKTDGKYRVAVKGAPEAVLEACTEVRTPEGDRSLDKEQRGTWLDANDQMAEAGLRVLAVATKEAGSVEADPYDKLVFLGLLGLLDPPRQDVASAIQACRKAGIRIIMVTGDQPVTARHIGSVLGLTNGDRARVIHGKDLRNPEELSQDQRKTLLQASIFARVNPKQKLDLISLHQKNGSIVAMTGDGVNDAPALKKADIGVAMGRRGTQVAREAADVVLKDDAFKTIVVAIQQGRAIFDNIRKFILFLLSGNVGEIMIVVLALLAGAPLPILPLQILYLNMIGDVFPALALGVGKGDASKMRRPPRDSEEPILTRGHWLAIVGYGFLIAASVLVAFRIALTSMGMDTGRAVTLSFLTLAFARLWHVFNMRDGGSPLLNNDITRNPFVWGSLGLCASLLVAAVYLPGISTALSMVPPGIDGWGVIFGMSLIPLLIGQTVKQIRA